MEELAKKISKGLELPNFLISNLQDYPYELHGRCECLGFEIWLNKNDSKPNFEFQIEIATQDSIEEIFNNQMFDISPWLSRYISRICCIETCYHDESLKKDIFLKDGYIGNG